MFNDEEQENLGNLLKLIVNLRNLLQPSLQLILFAPHKPLTSVTTLSTLSMKTEQQIFALLELH